MSVRFSLFTLLSSLFQTHARQTLPSRPPSRRPIPLRPKTLARPPGRRPRRLLAPHTQLHPPIRRRPRRQSLPAPRPPAKGRHALRLLRLIPPLPHRPPNPARPSPQPPPPHLFL